MEPEPESRASEPPPLLGTWPRVYAAVLLLELAVLIALAAFSSWSY